MSFVHLAGLGRALSAASAALVLPSSGPAAVDHARGVALEGVYTYSLLMGASKASWSAAHSFRLEIRGCEWTIEHRDLSSATNKGLASVRGIAACDGANVYTVDYQSGAAARIAWGRDYDSVKDKLPEGLISILPGLYPPPDGPVVQHIWLALASGCALPGARGTTKPLAPVDLALFSDRRFSCGYEWFTNAGGSGLPSLALISDGYTLARSSKGSIVRVPFASRLSAGFTNTLVNWRQAASINGVLLPMDVECTSFVPGATGLFVSFKYRCQVTNASECNMASIPPRLSEGAFAVTDRRFMDQGYASFRYVVTNRWLPMDDANIARLMAHSPKGTLESEVHRNLYTPQTGKLSLGGALMVVLLLCPFGALLIWRWRAKTQHNNIK